MTTPRGNPRRDGRDGRDLQLDAPPPQATSLRLVGPAAERSDAGSRARIVAPLGAKFSPDAAACAAALGPADVVDVDAVARALPDADTLPAGALLVVLPNVVDPPSLANRVLAAFGRGRSISRALRATALVARGYVRVGAGVDPASHGDLVWGYAPTARATARD